MFLLSWSTYQPILSLPAVRIAGFIYPALGHILVKQIYDGYNYKKNYFCNVLNCKESIFSSLLNSFFNHNVFVLYYSLLFLSIASILFTIFCWSIIKRYGDLEYVERRFLGNSENSAYINKQIRKYKLNENKSFSDKLKLIFRKKDFSCISAFTIITLLLGVFGLILNGIINIVFVSLHIFFQDQL